MKHLSLFKASKVAEYILANCDRFPHAAHVAREIELYSRKDGMVYHFVVKDSLGDAPMPEIEANCVMYSDIK